MIREIDDLEWTLKALGDPVRLQIILFLSKSCCAEARLDEEGGVRHPTASEVCCSITGKEKVTSTISHHLKELKEAGLIEMHREGKFFRCRLNQSALRSVGESLIAISSGEPK